MSHSRLSDEEIACRGEEIYQKVHKSKLEADNIGRLLSIDVETGNFELGSDSCSEIEAPLRLHIRNPNAAIYTVRIGYNAVVALSGVVERTS